VARAAGGESLIVPPLSRSDLDRVATRTLLLQATWNYERQQGIGWAYCLEPALRRLYPDPSECRARLAEHTAYFNTQPTLASLCLGAVIQLEERRSQALADPQPPPPPSDPPAVAIAASGAMGSEALAAAGPIAPPVLVPAPEVDPIPRVKAVMGSALAALGDRLFWLTLRPFAACLGVFVALAFSWLGAVALWLCYNSVHLAVRFRGVEWGYREGPGVLGEGLRKRVTRSVHALSVFGSAIVGVVVAMLLVPGGEPQTLVFQGALAGGLALGLVTAQRARPSPTQWRSASAWPVSSWDGCDESSGKAAGVVTEAQLVIRNQLGLHARACALFVKTAARFKSHVLVSRDDLEVNGKSIMGVMMLAAEEGSLIKVKADGEDEQAAIAALTELVNGKFGGEP
jgi:phosphotransferase system HPr (HPr) family protein